MGHKIVFASLIGALAAAVCAFSNAAIAFRNAALEIVAWAWDIGTRALASASPLGAESIPTIASVAYSDPSPQRAYRERRLQREKTTPRQRMPALLAA